MIKFIVLLAIVAVFAFLPVLAMDAVVMPQLNDLAGVYGQADQVAEQVAQQGR